MGDRSYMAVTIHDCPAKKRQVAQLLAEYDLTVSRWDEDSRTVLPQPDEVAAGEEYTVEEISLGSEEELADKLIALTPRISFTAKQEPHYTAPGGIVAYCPQLGRFDGLVDTEGVTLTPGGVLDLIDEADKAGYLDRDSVLRGGSPTVRPRREWEAKPGLRELIEVVGGIPWDRDLRTVPRAKRRAWLAVIDRRWAEKWERGQELLAGCVAELEAVGCTYNVVALREAGTILLAPPEGQFVMVRDAAKDVEARLKETAAAQDLRFYHDLPHGHLPSHLKGWADLWEPVWQGRRRP